jgi:anti-anti-sigma factor
MNPHLPSASPDPAIPGRVMVASVVDLDDTVTATIYRHVEPIMPSADLHAVIITIDGDVDSDAAAHLEYTVRRALAGGTPVCCDLSGATYFGAAGASAVLAALRYAADAGALFLLRGARGMTLRVLEVVGVDRSLIMR